MLPLATSAVPVLPATRAPRTWAETPEPFWTTSSMASFTVLAVSEETARPRLLGWVVETVTPSGESTWSTT